MKVEISNINEMSLGEACERMGAIREDVDDVYFKRTPFDVKMIMTKEVKENGRKTNGS